MMGVSMKSLLRKSDEVTRRELLSSIARTTLGVSIVPFANELMNTVALAGPAAAAGKAEHIIYLFMSGAMSHIDTFDPKPALVRDHGLEIKADHPEIKDRPGYEKIFLKRVITTSRKHHKVIH